MPCPDQCHDRAPAPYLCYGRLLRHDRRHVGDNSPNTPTRSGASHDWQGAALAQPKQRLGQDIRAQPGPDRVALLLSASEPSVDSLQLVAREALRFDRNVGLTGRLATKARAASGAAALRYPYRHISQTPDAGRPHSVVDGAQA